jgi:hypothetical protein
VTAATSITVRIPLTVRRRGGRKLVVTPAGSAPGAAPARTRADPALVKALVRAHRWKRLLEEGGYSSLAELASICRRVPVDPAAFFVRGALVTGTAAAILADASSLATASRPLGRPTCRVILWSGGGEDWASGSTLRLSA